MFYNGIMIFKNGKKQKFSIYKRDYLEFVCFLFQVVNSFEIDFDSKISSIIISCEESEEE